MARKLKQKNTEFGSQKPEELITLQIVFEF
jgi:hypothetical protein